MYIIANLPAMYGRFQQIKKENYPFKRAFGQYLEALSRLGLALEAEPDRLSGIVEDALFPGERVPDLPEGDGEVNFRFELENPVIEEYFHFIETTNKHAVMQFIRLALRLSERYGTSLSRLTLLIERLQPEDVDHSVETVDNLPPIRIVKRVPESRNPADPEPGRAREIPTDPKPEPSSVLDRLAALTEKGDQLLHEGEGEGAPVVQTNPALGDFL